MPGALKRPEQATPPLARNGRPPQTTRGPSGPPDRIKAAGACASDSRRCIAERAVERLAARSARMGTPDGAAFTRRE